ncbi:hypothetical protein PHMEG_00017645, partial [Phytophthora megakarya]
KYANGVRMEWWRTSSRACKWAWTLTYVLLFGHFYLIVCTYELIEWLCLGWQTVAILLLVINYYCASFAGVLQGDFSAVNLTVLLGSLAVVVIALVSHWWRWFEGTKDERSPARLVGEGYASYRKDLEEQEQAERLSEAFWCLDGGTDDVMRHPVPTVSGIRAEQGKMRAKMKAAQDSEALRGCQAKVGENVTCGTDGHRLGDRSEPPHAVIQVAEDIWEDQLVEEARSAAARRSKSGTRTLLNY